MNNNYQQRFAALSRLYGNQLAEQFLTTHVVVIGIGGVGSWAAEGLARTGFGKITLLDFDDVMPSNINRQILADSNTLGQSKVEVMARRIRSINPDCQVNAVDDRLSEKNCEKFFSTPDALIPEVNYIIDAIDSLRPKAALIDYCKRHKIPIMTTGGAGGLSDPSQVTFADLSRTHNDALAAKLRYELRKNHHFPRDNKKKFKIECVFSTEQVWYPQTDGSVSHQRPQLEGRTLDCATGYGSCCSVTSTFGMLCVARIIEKMRKALEHSS